MGGRVRASKNHNNVNKNSELFSPKTGLGKTIVALPTLSLLIGAKNPKIDKKLHTHAHTYTHTYTHIHTHTHTHTQFMSSCSSS